MSLRLRSDCLLKSILKDKARNNKTDYEQIIKMIELISVFSDKAVFAYNNKFDNISSKLMRIRVIQWFR